MRRRIARVAGAGLGRFPAQLCHARPAPLALAAARLAAWLEPNVLPSSRALRRFAFALSSIVFICACSGVALHDCSDGAQAPGTLHSVSSR